MVPFPPPSKPATKHGLIWVEPDKRTLGWCKVKKDYADGSDSMDLVPIGAWHGNGRKAGWWSPILLALRNEDDGTLQAVCKCISGFTDQFYKDLNVTYSPTSANTTFEKPWEYESALTPESTLLGFAWLRLMIVWFVAREVWEVRFADVTLSPVYTAGMGLVSEERGLSMRFPRFIRIREDKGIDEASTGRQLAEMWEKQNETVAPEPQEDVEEEG
jgi:DNA ligase 1